MFFVSDSIKNIPHTFLWLIKYHIQPIVVSTHLDFTIHSISKLLREIRYENL